MSGVLLDIGARCTTFARHFKRLNPDYSLMYLCGEPHWNGPCPRQLSVGQIIKIEFSYGHFSVPDASLDFVTLNAFYPLIGTPGIEDELVRTLIPSRGVFISAHPIGLHPILTDAHFDRFVFTENERYGLDPHCGTFDNEIRWFFWRIPVCTMKILADGKTLHYPANHVNASRLQELDLHPDKRKRSSSYIYSGSDNPPSVQVWIRNNVSAP